MFFELLVLYIIVVAISLFSTLVLLVEDFNIDVSNLIHPLYSQLLLLLLVFLYQAVKDFDTLKMWLSKDHSFGASYSLASLACDLIDTANCNWHSMFSNGTDLNRGRLFFLPSKLGLENNFGDILIKYSSPYQGENKEVFIFKVFIDGHYETSSVCMVNQELHGEVR